MQRAHLCMLLVSILACCQAEDFFNAWFHNENLSDVEIEQHFAEFVVQYNKMYASAQEYQMRLGIFKEAVQRVQRTNKQLEAVGSSGRSGITKFSDMTPEEFRATILMPSEDIPCAIDTKHQMQTEARDYAAPADTPSSFDWREKGAVTPVKDQGSVGTCWAFSTTGSIEGQWFLAGNPLVSLSEEQLNDCDPNDCSVFGGWPCRAYQYVIEIGGLMSESEYPYCVGTGDCYPCMPKHFNKTFCGPGPTYCNETQFPCRATPNSNKFVAHIKGWKSFSTDETAIASAMVATGPLSFLMNAGGGFPPLQDHYWGVYDPMACDPNALDHAVLGVGYGWANSTWSDTPYWLVKNSWGQDWGEGGYFRIVRGKGLCGINTGVSSSVV